MPSDRASVKRTTACSGGEVHPGAELVIGELGICQWFHYNDQRTLNCAVRALQQLGVRHLRTGVSWADFHRPGGRAWYDRQMEALRPFEVLLSVWHTPPSISENHDCNGPPRRLEDYADFIAQLINDYGDAFTHLELWNEPNNRLKWDFPKFDPDWSKWSRMVAGAASVAKAMGKPTVLGGMIPVDHHWLRLVESHGALQDVDIVAIHGFPHMWWPNHPNWDWYRDWQGWRKKVEYIAGHAGGRPIWVTETGLATWDLDKSLESRLGLQVEALQQAAAAPAERVYWYTLIDLDPAKWAIEGFHVDENEYHLGLLRHDGSRKPAYEAMGEPLANSPPGRA